MRLDLAVDEEAHRWRPTPEWEALAQELVQGVGPRDGWVELVITGDATVRELNAHYRGQDRPTDVLSFSYLEGHAASRQSLLAGACPAREFSADPPHEAETLVGQILVSVDFLEARGPREGRGLSEEILFLLTHGVLHVLGYDHVEDEEASEMEAAERAIFEPLHSRAKAVSGGEAA